MTGRQFVVREAHLQTDGVSVRLHLRTLEMDCKNESSRVI